MIRQNLAKQLRQASYAFPTPLSSARPQFQALSTRLPAPARAKILSRWYSSAEPAEGAKSGETSQKEPAPVKEEDPRDKELQAKNKEVIELKDKYMRTVADYRNLQEQTRREVKAAKDFALQKFARDLIESVDNLDLALQSVPADKLVEENKDLRQLHGGLKMTETILMNTLKKHGMERFDPSENGDRFDPNKHEATFQTPQPNKEDGTVFHTTSKGFMLNGRVLRAAKVGVVKNS